MRFLVFLVSALFSALFSMGCGDDAPIAPMGDGGLTDVPTPDGGPPVVLPQPLGGNPMTACPAGFQDAAPPAGLNAAFMAGGQSREFVLTLPDATHSGLRPIFIAFNGTGEDGSIFTTRAMLQDFADRGFIVVAPSSNENGRVWPVWDDMRMSDDHDRPNADLDLFDTLLACMGAHFEVDKNRIYIGGHSAGGIFTNAVVQRRSEILAGAVVASGIIDLTSPPDLGDLDDMFVLVTWGGDGDSYGNADVPSFNFVEQAANATTFYANQPNVGTANCHADPSIGHAWLPINTWVMDRLLEHPKGRANATDLTIPPAPAGITCSTAPYTFVSPIVVECGPSTEVNCQEFCQFTADCTAENASVSGVVRAQLQMLGFMGDDNSDCTGCMTWCEDNANSAADEAILACIQTAATEGTMCAGGIAGFTPYPTAIDGCCEGRSDSDFCLATCRVFLSLPIATSFFPNCVALLEE